MRVLIGTCEIAGFYGQLARGLTEHGIRATFVSYDAHPFAYGGESSTWLLRSIQGASRRASNNSRSRFMWLFWYSLRVALSTVVFLRSIFTFDAFVFGFGQSLLPHNLDLWALRLFRKKVIVVMAHGSELRPPYIDGARQSPAGEPPNTSTYLQASRRSIQRLRRIEKYAHYIIGAPYSSTQFAQRKLVNFFALGVPASPSTILTDRDTPDPARVDRSAGSARIFHAPSHPAAKGSFRITAAVESLKARGFEIEFVELRGRPNAEVLDELRRCDFVVDQLYSDTPMAGLAAEAARFGIPTVVGGYRLEQLKDHLPRGMYPPSQTCHPDEVESAIEQLIVDLERRRALGNAAQKFVSTQWTAALVAERYIQLLHDDVPPDWWLEPGDVTYIEGAGQPVERTRQIVRDLVAAYGIAALQLSHRPDLERAFLDLVEASEP